MQLYNVICCFLWYLPYFYPIYEFKFNVLVFLTMAPSKIGVGPQGHNSRQYGINKMV